MKRRLQELCARWRALTVAFGREVLAAHASPRSLAMAMIVGAMVALLREDPQAWAAQPERRYVFGPGGRVTWELPWDSALFRVRFPI